MNFGVFPSSGARKTIFFDIDDTICTIDAKHDFDCLRLKVKFVEYYMFPHFKCLLDYLISHNCEIAFFSAAPKRRNMDLLNNYLSHDTMFGTAGFDRLKAEGQFKVYSDNHLRDNCKSLKALLRSDQCIDDTVLIDDTHGNAPEDEQPLILIPGSKFHFNNMYYLLGLFINYFEYAAINGISLRAYYTSLPKTRNLFPDDVLAFTLTGLNEVRKITPTAVLHLKFGSENYIQDTFGELDLAVFTHGQTDG